MKLPGGIMMLAVVAAGGDIFSSRNLVLLNVAQYATFVQITKGLKALLLQPLTK